MVVKAAYRCEFDVTGLDVTVAAAGRDHDFIHNDRNIKAALPKRYRNSESKKPQKDHHDAEVFGWRPVNRGGTKHYRASEIHVYRLSTYVELKRKDDIKVRKATSSKRNINIRRQHFESLNDVAHVESVAKHLTECANNAFTYWCRVARWMSGNWKIGMPIIDQRIEPSLAYFVTFEPLAHLYSPTAVFEVELTRGMKLETWKKIGAAVSENIEPPISFEHLCEARHKRQNGDHRGAIINAAISVETLFRQKVYEAIAVITDDEEAITRYLDAWNINAIISNRKGISTIKAQYISKQQIKSLRKLFNTRNEIMHRGALHVSAEDSELAVNVASEIYSQF